MEGEKAVFDQKALDNEEVESNGFLSAREQTQAQQSTTNKKIAVKIQGIALKIVAVQGACRPQRKF